MFVQCGPQMHSLCHLGIPSGLSRAAVLAALLLLRCQAREDVIAALPLPLLLTPPRPGSAAELSPWLPLPVSLGAHAAVRGLCADAAAAPPTPPHSVRARVCAKKYL